MKNKTENVKTNIVIIVIVFCLIVTSILTGIPYETSQAKAATNELTFNFNNKVVSQEHILIYRTKLGKMNTFNVFAQTDNDGKNIINLKTTKDSYSVIDKKIPTSMKLRVFDKKKIKIKKKGKYKVSAVNKKTGEKKIMYAKVTKKFKKKYKKIKYLKKTKKTIKNKTFKVVINYDEASSGGYGYDVPEGTVPYFDACNAILTNRKHITASKDPLCEGNLIISKMGPVYNKIKKYNGLTYLLAAEAMSFYLPHSLVYHGLENLLLGKGGNCDEIAAYINILAQLKGYKTMMIVILEETHGIGAINIDGFWYEHSNGWLFSNSLTSTENLDSYAHNPKNYKYRYYGTFGKITLHKKTLPMIPFKDFRVLYDDGLTILGDITHGLSPYWRYFEEVVLDDTHPDWDLKVRWR
ncbi:MAG: hypothetical protein LBD17_03090 [Endomicrobium sp.]|nr:hypothetical protein [Endomicrobium sp.]